METAYDRVLKLATQILEESQKLTSALHNKTQECESYKMLVKSYEESQKQLIAKIEMLTALQKTAA